MMERLAPGLGLALAGGIVIGALGVHTLAAQERKEAYAPPGAERRTLVNEPLHGMEDRIITVDQYTLPAGWVGGKHYHTGPVYVYVLEGSFTMEEQGMERHTFGAGELYKEPIGTPMQARNLNSSALLKILVFQVTPKGEPLMYKAD
jgi:quercetin dioxygenase-like cupin family protein